ncbi:hypothetical protein AN619_19910 [Thermotalea metallivorans]|uniref:Uncharacterized protein n=1 Tax=Thermotalea metallivorans TaxID=520762 RepID=A0A140L396_9FIRM|nr:hypothetical protein AN619_19910 [Thermotalea metallivorans]
MNFAKVSLILLVYLILIHLLNIKLKITVRLSNMFNSKNTYRLCMFTIYCCLFLILSYSGLNYQKKLFANSLSLYDMLTVTLIYILLIY